MPSRSYRFLKSCGASLSNDYGGTSRLKTIFFVLGIVMGLAVAPSVSLAALDWRTTVRQMSATAGDKEVMAEFGFSNSGTVPVTITKLETSCDCTQATPSSTIIPPGGSGNIKAVFTLGDRVGRQEKTIQVTTNDPTAERTTLVLRVNIAEVVSTTPRVLLWNLQQSPVEKRIEFRGAGNYGILSLSPVPDTPGFKCRLEALPDAQTYRLYVTPISTNAPVSAIIRFTAEVEGRPQSALAVYAVVK
jgi:hypothetical protein